MDIGQVLCLRVYGPRRTAILTEKSLANKGFITWLWGEFFLRDTAGSPERVR